MGRARGRRRRAKGATKRTNFLAALARPYVDGLAIAARVADSPALFGYGVFELLAVALQQPCVCAQCK